MHRRNLVLALIALLAALPLTGCSAKLPDPATAVRAATLNAAEAKTVRFELTAGHQGVKDSYFDISMEGVLDLERSAFSLEVDFEDAGLHWRSVGDRTYISLDGDTWFESDTQGQSDFFAELLFFDLDDPFSPIEDFGAKSSQLSRDGEEEIRGHRTTRYAGTVSASELPSFDSVTDDVRFELWIDEDNLPARLTVSYEFEADDFLEEPIPGETPRTVFMIEYFDWGEPAEIEAPPADQVIDIDDDPFGGMGDPFEGADCYGEKNDDCLGVNAELDAKAADPALCQGAEARVCLVPIGKVRAGVVDAIVKFHKETAGIDVLVLPSLPLDPEAIYRDTSQVDDHTLYEMLQAHYGVGDLTPSTFIAITPIDVRPRDGEYGWMFGSRWGRDASGQHNHGVFSYFRMVHVEPYDGSPITDELIHLRASKYVGRYVALLHLDYPYTNDIEYLNYSDMYGFGDLDGIGTKWPSGPKPCEGDGPIICVIPDGDYLDFFFEDDLRLAMEELSAELGLRIEMRKYGGYYTPTEPDWGEEYAGDLHETFPALLERTNVTVIGVSDDPFAQDASVAQYLDRAWPEERLTVVSVADSSGDTLDVEQLKALLLRAIAQAHYGKALNSDPSSLLYEGATEPSDLDGKTAPALP